MKYFMVTVTMFFLLVSGPLFARDCYTAFVRSPVPFMGNHNEIFQLDDGSLWKVLYGYEYLYEYYPEVVLCHSSGKLYVDGRELIVIVVAKYPHVSGVPSTDLVVESSIDRNFEGWQGETIVELTNGQIWKQSEYYYHQDYSFMPEVTVYMSQGVYKMKVEGIDRDVEVERLQ